MDARLRAEMTAGSRLIVPTIVLFELRHGIARNARREASAELLDSFLAGGFEIVPFDAGDALEAGEIRAGLADAGTPIGPFDVLIAAQARRRGAVLVTDNLREFQRVPELMVTDWGG